MENRKLNCPSGHGEMELAHKQKQMNFRGVDIEYPMDYFVCRACGLEVGTISQGGSVQKAIANAYRKKRGLLTSKEIIEARKNHHLTQEALADRMKVGIASIKRWEGGIIQSKSMDKMLRQALSGEFCGDLLTGNRPFVIPRVKMALLHLEEVLGVKVLKERDRMLFASKYMWYIDMVAYREMGQSITGATYAALPMGPQLNNYKDLVEEIIGATVQQTEPLTEEEKRIIEKVAFAFHRPRDVYNASHRETVWREKSTGNAIPYSDAYRLTEL